MGKIADDLQKAIKARDEFERFKLLKEKSFRVFDFHAGINMNFIEDTVNKEWNQLINLVPTCDYAYIQDTFYKLKNGMINRREFREMLDETVKEAKLGEVVEINKFGIKVACGKGVLLLEEVQIEGSKRMSAKDFANGNKVKVGDMLC